MTRLFSVARRRLRAHAMVTVILVVSWPLCMSAQWISLPLPNTPRAEDGTPDLSAPVPTTDDGQVDLSGIWRITRGINAPLENPAGLPGRMEYFMPEDEEIPLRPEAAKLYQERTDNFGGGRPSERCLPHGIPDAMLYGGPMKIVQTENLSVILFEAFTNYRQIHSDGRAFPDNDPQSTWFGYSVGRWDDNTFVFETMGFNNMTWMDDSGLPHSEALKTTERFRRRDFGHMDLEITFDDPEMYTRPWSVSLAFVLWPDTELIENICENERDAI